MGSLTEPPEPNGLSDWILFKIGVVEEVRTGRSASLRLQPSCCSESRNEDDAM